MRGWRGRRFDFNAIQHTTTVADQVDLDAGFRLPVVKRQWLARLAAGFDPFADNGGLSQLKFDRLLKFVMLPPSF